MIFRKLRTNPLRHQLQPIQVFNRQRRHHLDTRYLCLIAERVLDRLQLNGREISIILVSDRAMRRLNSAYRGTPKTTDVLSFADSGIQNYLGDIFISAETAAAQSRLAGHSLRRELGVLTFHGVLHLAGYDHETDGGRMDRLERRLRREILSPSALSATRRWSAENIEE